MSSLLLRTIVTFTLSALLAGALAAQDEDIEELEAEFEKTMSGATLVGAFTDTDHPDAAPHREKYVINKVTKLRDDLWRFEARIQYGKNDVTVPIPLQVKWAGDTPVITLTDLLIPGLGTFTARVLVYRGKYAGTWSGGTHGGQLFGDVVSASEETDQNGEADGDADDGQAGHWPQYRGPAASGVAEGHPLPEGFELETGDSVLFKVPVPGLAHSSPIIWGDRLFLTTAERIDEQGAPVAGAEQKVGLYGDINPVEDEGPHRFSVRCLDKHTGAELWSRVVFEGVPEFPRHPKGSFAASTPATDGERVVAFFGSEGLHAFTLEGDPLWSKNLGKFDAGFYMVPSAQWGVAGSPILFEGSLFLQCDVLDDSYLLALDATNGEERWRTSRDDVPTWSTPAVHAGDGRRQVIVNGYRHIGGYDFDTGEELWILEGGGDIPVPTPILAHDLIYITNAHGAMAPIYAIRTDATDDIYPGDPEMPGVEWFHPRRGNYMQTPIVVDDIIYLCADSGVLTALEATTGEEVYRQRQGMGRDGFTASAVAGDGKLYLTSEEGVVRSIVLGPDYELIEVSELGETCMATPAISEGVIYFRTFGHLVAISATSAE